MKHIGILYIGAPTNRATYGHQRVTGDTLLGHLNRHWSWNSLDTNDLPPSRQLR